MSTWPENCPTCGGEWKIRSKTMGAAHGQPHQGRCINNHWWYEGKPESPRTIQDEEDAVVREALDRVRLAFESRGAHFDDVAQEISDVIRDAWQAQTSERTP